MKLFLLSFIFLFFSSLTYGQEERAQEIQDSIIIDFGEQLENAFFENDTTFVTNNFNSKKFYNYFLIEDPFNEELTVYNKGVKSSNYPLLLTQKVNEIIESGGYYSFITYGQVDGDNYSLTFRLYEENAGLNYHELYLEPNQDGKYEITDVYIYAAGEFQTETMKSLYLPLAKKLNNEGVSGDELNEEEIAATTLISIRNLIKEEKYKAASILIKNVSSEYKTSPAWFLYEMQLASYLEDDEEYLKVIERAMESTDNRAVINLHSVDFYILQEQPLKAIEAIDSLDSQINDSFLDYLRGNIYYDMGELDLALEKYLQLKENYPYLWEAHDALLTVYADKKDIPSFIEILNAFVDDLETEKEMLEETVSEFWPEIEKTDEYKAWQAQSN